MASDLLALGASPHWQAEASHWAFAAARAAGVVPTGSFDEVKTRSWSTVWRLPTTGKPLWFKENAPSQSFEAALVEKIWTLAPQAVPPVVGVDPGRGWLLSADVGQPLGERGGVEAQDCVDMLASYARLQRTLEPHVNALTDCGVSSHAEDTLATWVMARADELAGLPSTDPRAISAAERNDVDGAVHLLTEAAADLAALPIPVSLQHNDLHLGNAFRDDGGFTFIDFGDALLSHPFAAARIPLWSLREDYGAAPGTDHWERASAAYLEPWTDVAPLERLRALLPAAERVSCVHRAMSWHRLQQDVPTEVFPAAYLPSVALWLLKAVAPDPYVGTTRTRE